MENKSPGSQAKSQKYPKQVNSNLKALKVYLSIPPGDRREGHRLLVWVTTGGRLELGVWRTIACVRAQRAWGFTHQGLRCMARLWP